MKTVAEMQSSHPVLIVTKILDVIQQYHRLAKISKSRTGPYRGEQSKGNAIGVNKND